MGAKRPAANPTREIRLGQRVTVTTGRRRTPATRLSADRIVEVAITQMRERGYDAVTMRSIAKELGTGPASLYAHVANRAELDQLVVGRVASQWEIPDPDPATWDTQLRGSLRALLDIYRANPGVARCSMGMIPLSEDLLAVTERLISLLKSGGVPDQYCAWFVDVAALYVGSVAMEEDIWIQRHAGQDPDEAAAMEHVTEDAVVAEVRNVFASLPAQQFPFLHALAEVMTTGDADDRFGFGVDLLVGGLKAMSAQA
jgi:AcrR family transcriptional regulator